MSKPQFPLHSDLKAYVDSGNISCDRALLVQIVRELSKVSADKKNDPSPQTGWGGLVPEEVDWED